MAKHLTVRVAWHQQRWNGTVCRHASDNPFCMELDRIRSSRNDTYEDSIALRHFADLPIDQLPPCRSESGTFISDREIPQVRVHPYSEIPKAKATHGALRPTVVKVPPYSTLVVPFRWMLRQNQQEIDSGLAAPLPPDEKSPFASPWVFSSDRQDAVSRLFFDQVAKDQSLMLFYTKSGHPLGGHINRLVVGIGTVQGVGPLLRYDSTGPNSYPLWDRVVSHSIRPSGQAGFLLPYHDYLDDTGDPEENERRLALLAEIALVPEPTHVATFSYAGEHAEADVALSTLVRALEVVRVIRRHGVAPGPWDHREEWVNLQIGRVWRQRGAFPGAGGMLEALGCRLGTSLVMELIGSGTVKALDDPWPTLDAMLRGQLDPPAPYRAEMKAAVGTYTALPDDRRRLLRLLSRFALTAQQARRWWDPKERVRGTRRSVSDSEMLENPYVVAECDLGDDTDWPVPIGVIDRGLLPDPPIVSVGTAPGTWTEPVMDRLVLGIAPGGWVLAARQQAVLVLGPPRSGKTSAFVTPNVLGAPGAVVTTSTKTDVAVATAPARSVRDRAWFWDPSSATEGPVGTTPLRWSPVPGCADWETALRRAHLLTAAARPGRGLEDSSHWVERAGALLAPLLHAADLIGVGMRVVMRWVLTREVSEATAILAERSTELPRDSLEGILATEERARLGIFSTAASILSPYRSGRALAGAEGAVFDGHAFARSSDTLYVCAPAATQDQLAPLVVALLDEIRLSAYAAARLDAPMVWALDEVAQIAPIPFLPAVVAEGGGQGLLTLACLQDLSQARARWGPAAEGFFSLFGAKVILPGIGDTKTLESVSALAGEHQVATTSRTAATWPTRGHRPTRTTSYVWRRRLPVEAVSQGRPGCSLVVEAGRDVSWVQLAAQHGGTPPIETNPPRRRTPWWMWVVAVWAVLSVVGQLPVWAALALIVLAI